MNMHEELEMVTSNKRPDRECSDDILVRMHMALEQDDKQWFEELAVRYRQVSQAEQDMRDLLGVVLKH